MTRATASLLLAAAVGCASFCPVAGAGDKGSFKPLFNGKDLTGWKTFLADAKADPGKTFVVKDGEIQVSGEPFGYFYSDRPYKNYVIGYSWTYPKDQPAKTTMNSGLLLHIQEPHKVWPKSIEPQGRYMDHGKLFFIGFGKDAKTEGKFDAAAQKKRSRQAMNGTPRKRRSGPTARSRCASTARWSAPARPS